MFPSIPPVTRKYSCKHSTILPIKNTVRLRSDEKENTHQNIEGIVTAVTKPGRNEGEDGVLKTLDMHFAMSAVFHLENCIVHLF
jgi:hypothetical protein